MAFCEVEELFALLGSAATPGVAAAFLDAGCQPEQMGKLAGSLLRSGAWADGALLILQPTLSNLPEELRAASMKDLAREVKTVAGAKGLKAKLMDIRDLPEDAARFMLCFKLRHAGGARPAAQPQPLPAGAAVLAGPAVALERALLLPLGGRNCYAKRVDSKLKYHLSPPCNNDGKLFDRAAAEEEGMQLCSVCSKRLNGAKSLRSVLKGEPATPRQQGAAPAAAPARPRSVAAAAAVPLPSRPQAALAQPAAQPAAALPGPRPSAPAPTAGAHVDVISTPAGKKLHLVPDCHHVKGKANLSTQPYDRERHARQDLCSSTKCKAMAHLLGCEAAPRAQPPCASSC